MTKPVQHVHIFDVGQNGVRKRLDLLAKKLQQGEESRAGQSRVAVQIHKIYSGRSRQGKERGEASAVDNI